MSERVTTPVARPPSVTSSAVERPLDSSSKASSIGLATSTVGSGESMTSTTRASSTSGLRNSRSSRVPSWMEPVDGVLDPLVGGDGDQRRHAGPAVLRVQHVADRVDPPPPEEAVLEHPI